MSNSQSYSLDPELGYLPTIPLPFYVWQRLWWQKVRCFCGETFISRNNGLLPEEYERHYALTHITEWPK